ncbi:GMC family oxidoreductase [Phytohalomonas tamaricis]|uniref:GMC family oxidoreductase n=1 Tax=Phytohalomonas tamaricis TaxID=2081032 RepID=UPI000D0B4146|nr:GMC family oxidoreductase [Phytohalomonas tamaricis]
MASNSTVIRKEPVDAVIVGLGWTGSIMGMELTDAGLNVLALERGNDRTNADFTYPKPADELAYGVRMEMMQRPSQAAITIRRNLNETALPNRYLTSFLPGDGVGGAGVHWTGVLYRATPVELKLKSFADEHFDKGFLPDDMTIQDYGVSYEELEPHYDFFEKVCGISGQAGNINGQLIEGGNPFEGPRANPYPLPPLPGTYNNALFAQATKNLGWHPYPYPSANVSQAWKNPYGMQLGPCNFCGFCSKYGCLNYSKSSPQTCILDALKRRENFAYRTNCEVTRVELDSDGKKATGVTYIDGDGNRVFQPAELVIVASYALNNVRLLLLSGIGKPYDPVANTGVVGRNYSYQMTGSIDMFFDDIEFNPFVAAGANGQVIDDFSPDTFDSARHGFIGGSYIYTAQGSGAPISNTPTPGDAPKWGSGWKKAVKDNYGHSMSMGTTGTNMAYRDCYLSLDPNYRDPNGDPLLRMTLDWHDNDIRMTRFMRERMLEIVRELNPRSHVEGFKNFGDHYDTRHYQSTHNVGGAIMGTDPSTSALNRYLQSWDVHNVFVMGANAFPQNMQHNPTGTVAALTYWSAKAIREQYLKNPGPLMSA